MQVINNSKVKYRSASRLISDSELATLKKLAETGLIEEAEVVAEYVPNSYKGAYKLSCQRAFYSHTEQSIVIYDGKLETRPYGNGARYKAIAISDDAITQLKADGWKLLSKAARTLVRR